MAPTGSLFSRFKDRASSVSGKQPPVTDNTSRISSPRPSAEISSNVAAPLNGNGGSSTPQSYKPQKYDPLLDIPRSESPPDIFPTEEKEKRRPPAMNIAPAVVTIAPSDLTTPTMARPNYTNRDDTLRPTATFHLAPPQEPSDTRKAPSRKSSMASILRRKPSNQSLHAQDFQPSGRRGSVTSNASSTGRSARPEHVPPVPQFTLDEASPVTVSLGPSTTASGLSGTTISASSSNLLSAPSGVDSDSVSIRSNVSSSGRKKKAGGWGGKKVSASGGIAGALAASGMSLAYPASGPPSPPLIIPPSSSPKNVRVNPAVRAMKSGHTPRTSIDSVLLSRREPPVTSPRTSEEPDVYPAELSDEVYDSPDALSFDEDDLPVTGFAVASNKRNADFHELFPDVTDGDYLIEDYGCAMQRDILVQGRLYVSENHLCFHANIFGWVTNIVIPFSDVVSLEKKMTAFVIPNAIQVNTRNAKYTFASFITRDTSYDVIHNIWRLSSPYGPTPRSDERRSTRSDSIDESSLLVSGLPSIESHVKHRTTSCECSKRGEHYDEVMMDCVLPGTPQQIHNLIWTSGFIKDFMSNNQKLIDIQTSDWVPIAPGSHLLSRNMSYIKPLNNSLGPRSTKCEITDEMLHVNFDEYASTLTTTRTPNVPSGGAFSVKTRTCLSWAGPHTTKVVVTSTVEWTGRSFVKSMIEGGARDGQRSYHVDLEMAMRSYIAQHKTEFFPVGEDPEDAAVVDLQTPVAPHPAVSLSPEDIKKARQRETEQKGLQWALDTVMGTWNVASQSTRGAIEILGELLETGSRSTLLGIVIFVLVISNAWTLMNLKGVKKLDAERRLQLSTGRVPIPVYAGAVVPDTGAEALRILLEEVMARTGAQPIAPPPLPSQAPAVTSAVSPQPAEEIKSIQDSISELEARVARLKGSMLDLNGLD